MRIRNVLAAEGHAAFFTDDQAAIRDGAVHDGLHYRGSPVTPGFRAIRQPAEALSVLLVLEDGQIAHGDCVSVQYSGVGGRQRPFSAKDARVLVEHIVAPALAGQPVRPFREAVESLAGLPPDSTAIAYGVSQALLDARARATGRLPAEVIVDEFGTGSTLSPVPVFTQCGEDRYGQVDAMILKGADALPHGLINSIDHVGHDGAKLIEYVRWVSTRVQALRADPAYRPVLHVDTYGIPGAVCGSVRHTADYLARLGDAAAPFPLRVEQPIDAGGRDDQIAALTGVRRALRRAGSEVQIVADEWCNTLRDVRDFVAAGAADMIHVKTPDLGGLDQTVLALRHCADNGVAGYCGGSCSETERSAQLSVHVAMACAADQVLAKPGMGADAGFSVVHNEMARVLALR